MKVNKLYDKVYYIEDAIDDPALLQKIIEESEEDLYIEELVSRWSDWSACSGEEYNYGIEKFILTDDERLPRIIDDFPEKTKDVYFYVDDGVLNMLEGECWEINNMKSHEVINNSDEDRIHLMIDIIPNKYINDN